MMASLRPHVAIKQWLTRLATTVYHSDSRLLAGCSQSFPRIFLSFLAVTAVTGGDKSGSVCQLALVRAPSQ